MITLGITGKPPFSQDTLLDISPFMFHDSSCALFIDGKLTHFKEEEKLTRIKHVNSWPSQSIAYCMERAGLSFAQLDQVAYYTTETELDRLIRAITFRSPGAKEFETGRKLIERYFKQFGRSLRSDELIFVDHQRCHANTGYSMSGFPDALVLCLDGSGDNSSGGIFLGKNGRVEEVDRYSVQNSLGLYYLSVINFLGFEQFEEYKAMGLAAYGDKSRFRNLFINFYELQDYGSFRINSSRLIADLTQLKNGAKEFLSGKDKIDLLAALQDSITVIVLHVLNYWRFYFGKEHLCFTGGVALNSSLNQNIIDSKLFRKVFIPPVPHDSGCSIGAGIEPQYPVTFSTKLLGNKINQTRHGQTVGDDISSILDKWKSILHYDNLNKFIVNVTASLLSEGNIIYWYQKGGELGPRSLGNSSILANPATLNVKRFINRYIKHRETYRPFAASILRERVDFYFPETTNSSDNSYMSFTPRIKKELKDTLRAICHINGTSRIQVVDKEDNFLFWELIVAFEQLSGIPMLLNTSFNGPHEPIVETINDAINTFMVSPVRYLVIDQFLVTKPYNVTSTMLLSFRIELFSHIILLNYGQDQYVVDSYRPDRRQIIRMDTFEILLKSENVRSSIEAIAYLSSSTLSEASLIEIKCLWSLGFIRLTPFDF